MKRPGSGDPLLHFGRRRRIDYGDRLSGNAGIDPARHEGAAHVAGPDENNRAGRRYAVHASPTVSNSTASIALLASIPDHTTNWKAWK